MLASGLLVSSTLARAEPVPSPLDGPPGPRADVPVATEDTRFASERMSTVHRALEAERKTLYVAPIGIAIQLVGDLLVGIRFVDRHVQGGLDHVPSRAAAEGLSFGGASLAQASLVSGSVSGLVASNQLRKLGVARHHRGLSVTALALSAVPIVATIPAFVLLVLHLQQTRKELARGEPVAPVPHGPTVSLGSFLEPRTGVVGTRLTIAF